MANRQEISFLRSEGNAWFNRNGEPAEDYVDPVLFWIKKSGIVPHYAVEVGCGTGWRMHRLSQEWEGCVCYGIEPSFQAIEYGKAHYPYVNFKHGTATDLNASISIYPIDLIIFGFCLYLCDRSDLFDIVALADKCLFDGGHIVIHDFLPEYPQKKKYHHLEGLWSYKMDYSKLWLANPAYTLTHQTMTRDGEAVTIIKKNEKDAWPAVI